MATPAAPLRSQGLPPPVTHQLLTFEGLLYMTVEEALALVETALDYQRLNRVQEIVFRHAWEGRSYTEMAKISGYEPDYIKDAGAKLWKLLSKALGEKVKKDTLQSVIKRYARRTQVNLQGNQVIAVNLSGADLSGSSLSVANLSGARLLFAKLRESDSCQADLQGSKMPNDKTESGKEIIQPEQAEIQAVQSNPENRLHYWNGYHLRSDEHLKIAEALERTGILFIPNPKQRLTTPEGRENQEFDFMILHQGKSGILQIDSEESQQEPVKEEELHRLFKYHGIRIVQHCDASRCGEEPDRVVQEFLEMLSQA